MNNATEQFIESESKAESLNNSTESDKIKNIPTKLNEESKSEPSENEQLVNGNSPDSEHNHEPSDTEADTNEYAKKAAADTPAEEQNQLGEWQDLLGSGSIMKKILIEGKPESRPQRLERCTINYECLLENGDLIEKQENLEVLLGDHEVSTKYKQNDKNSIVRAII